MQFYVYKFEIGYLNGMLVNIDHFGSIFITVYFLYAIQRLQIKQKTSTIFKLKATKSSEIVTSGYSLVCLLSKVKILNFI